jgi:hypothetical protein
MTYKNGFLSAGLEASAERSFKADPYITNLSNSFKSRQRLLAADFVNILEQGENGQLKIANL